MAGALDIQLTGPRIYAGTRVSEPMINGAGRPLASVADVEAGVALFKATCSAMAAIFFVLFLVFLLA